MSGLPPELDIDPRKSFSKDVVDKAFGYIAGKIRALEAFAPDWQEAVNNLRAFGLQRINEAIMPAYERVMALASFGFLKGDSTTPLSIEIGQALTLTIDGENQRDLFTPTEFVTLTRTSTPADWAICRVASYDAASGQLHVKVEAAEMAPGEHSDWQVTATAGSVAAAKALLASTRAARDAAEAIRLATSALRDSAAMASSAAIKAAEDANAAALLIEGGPVASINKKTGNITLDITWIGGLSEALAAKAEKGTTEAALNDRYTKGEVNTRLASKADQVAVDQAVNDINGKIATKADQAAVDKSISSVNQSISSANQWIGSVSQSLDATNSVVSRKADHQYVYDSIVNINNGKLNNSGDLSVTSNVLRINSAGGEPRIAFWRANIGHIGLMMTHEGDIVLINLDTSTVTHRFTSTGQVWCSNYGWLHSYINDRAYAYTENAKAWVNSNFVSQLRLTGGGEIGYRAGWAGMNSGEQITDVAWSTNSTSRGIDVVKTKYLQRYIPATGWITIWTD